MKHQLQPVHLLLVEDNPGDALLLRQALDDAPLADISLVHVDRLASALETLEREQFDLILLDLDLPDSHGFGSVDAIREQEALLPIIVLTGRSDRETGLTAVQRGAQDYLRKGELDGETVARSILYAIERQRAVAALSQAHDRESAAARHDPLTGLPNRILFQEQLTQWVASSARQGSILAVLYLDLDGFKDINDTLGHDAGDELLRSVANRINSCLRQTDSAARIGGDEFAVMLTGLSAPAMSEMVAGRIAKAVAEPHPIGDALVRVTASIGVSLYPADARDAATILQHADMAMYRSKDAGRAQTTFFDEAISREASRRSKLETSLRQAIDRDGLLLHYQPQVDAFTGKLVGVEALVRLVAEDGSLLGPNQFIPIAEETGLIIPLGERVVTEAFRQIRAWRKAHLDFGRVWVNASPRELRHAGFVERLFQAVLGSSGDPSAIGIELTESERIQDMDLAARILNRARDMGIRIALDDFCTGESSPAYLRTLPIDVLKIDRSFTNTLLHDRVSAAIAESISQLAQRLDLGLVVEGVEDDQQLQAVRQLAPDTIQGYLVSEPLPPAQLETWIENWTHSRTLRGFNEPLQRAA